jgi:hypothetical protein
MPIEYVLDHARRRLTIIGGNPLGVRDVFAWLDRQAADDAWAYRTLSELRLVAWIPRRRGYPASGRHALREERAACCHGRHPTGALWHGAHGSRPQPILEKPAALSRGPELNDERRTILRAQTQGPTAATAARRTPVDRPEGRPQNRMRDPRQLRVGRAITGLSRRRIALRPALSDSRAGTRESRRTEGPVTCARAASSSDNSQRVSDTSEIRGEDPCRAPAAVSSSLE